MSLLIAEAMRSVSASSVTVLTRASLRSYGASSSAQVADGAATRRFLNAHVVVLRSRHSGGSQQFQQLVTGP
jgi:hypothetical protein